MDPLFTSIFDSCWDLGSKFFYWLFDGYIQPKEDFSLLWDETKVINSTGDKPMLKSQNKTAQRQVYTFTIPVGLSIDNFTKNKDAIAQYLHQDIKNIRIELVNNMAEMTIYNPSNLSFNYSDYSFDYKTKEIRVPLGINLKDFSVVEWRATDPSSCHLLIGGATGSGKSVSLDIVLKYLSQRDDVDLWIQDVKFVDLVGYENCPRTKVYNQGTDYALETIKALTNEMAERYKYLKKHGYKNLNECKEKNKPNYIFYVVEELATFSIKEHKEYFNELSEILSKARAAGIICILVTQAPYAEILPGKIKCNLNSVLGLRTKTPEASKVISGEYNLVNLRGKGHSIFYTGGESIEMQVFKI